MADALKKNKDAYLFQHKDYWQCCKHCASQPGTEDTNVTFPSELICTRGCKRCCNLSADIITILKQFNTNIKNMNIDKVKIYCFSRGKRVIMIYMCTRGTLLSD